MRVEELIGDVSENGSAAGGAAASVGAGFGSLRGGAGATGGGVDATATGGDGTAGAAGTVGACAQRLGDARRLGPLADEVAAVFEPSRASGTSMGACARLASDFSRALMSPD